MKHELNDSGIIVYDMHDDYSLGRSSASKKAKEPTEPKPSVNMEDVDTEQMKRLGGFSGKVYDKLTYRTISGARVTIATDLTISTDERGNFHVTGIRPGNYRLRVNEEGYIVQSRKGTAVAGEITTINAFHLIPDCLAAERPQDVEWDDTTDEGFAEFALEPVSTTEITDQSVQTAQLTDSAPIISSAPAVPQNESNTGAEPCIETPVSPEVDQGFDFYETALLMSPDPESDLAREIVSELIEQSRVMNNVESVADQKSGAHAERAANGEPSAGTGGLQNPSKVTQDHKETDRRVELPTSADIPQTQTNADSSACESEQASVPKSVCESSQSDYSKQHAGSEGLTTESSGSIRRMWKSLRKKVVTEPESSSADSNTREEPMDPVTESISARQSDLELSVAQTDDLPNITDDPKPGVDAPIILHNGNAQIDIESCYAPGFNVTFSQPSLDQKPGVDAPIILLNGNSQIDMESRCAPELDVTFSQPSLLAGSSHRPMSLHEGVPLNTVPFAGHNTSSISMGHNPMQKVSISEYVTPVVFMSFDVPCPPAVSDVPGRYGKAFDKGSFNVIPYFQIDIGHASTEVLFGQILLQVAPNPNIENIPPLPHLASEEESETTKHPLENDTAGKPLKLVSEPVRVRRRPEQLSGEDPTREEHAVNDGNIESGRKKMDSKTQSKLLWWTKRGRKTPDANQESETASTSSSGNGNISVLQEQTTTEQHEKDRTLDSSTKPAGPSEKLPVAGLEERESSPETDAEIQESKPLLINEDTLTEIIDYDPQFLNEQEKEAMSSDEVEGVEAAGCTGTLQVFPNPAFKGLPITVTYQVKNIDCANTDNTCVHITIVDPDNERVLENFESRITCKKGSFNIGGFTVSTATYEAHTYHIYMHIATLDGMTNSPITHIPLDIKSIY